MIHTETFGYINILGSNVPICVKSGFARKWLISAPTIEDVRSILVVEAALISTSDPILFITRQVS